ncbi:hypothetical protein BDU57DRAFT_170397 [Ampelomyces quisqualis]|uniref:C2H2-type domain-containing protein n=1 Tax=Ampelomyces quisqualis TaxID=50730 RepID=A0A6A5QPE5_AMPQU|nr:hypothetical protein BDU57DRAFT_170397 [Ampelomyces quisqualis]
MLSQSPPINYTRTGRISKAKKGLKVHECECGRSYTRAEHLRRHQKNHSQDDALVCDYAGCGKPFHRPDLLLRHRDRHNGLESSSPQIDYSQGSSPQALNTSASLIPSPISSADVHIHSVPLYPAMPPMSPVQGLPVTSSPERHVSYSNNMRPNTSMPMPVDGVSPHYGWAPEPYSPSSGYNSPSIGAGEYNLYQNAYGHGLSRTRTPSNASLHDPWAQTPRSPSSSISTMPPCTWGSNEKIPTASLAYINTYPMAGMSMSTSMEATAGYGQFDLKTMIQRDEDEAAFLYRDHPYGYSIPLSPSSIDLPLRS